MAGLLGRFMLAVLIVNRKMVQDSMAWFYRQYLKDESLLQDEKAAREERRGLWSLPISQQVPPWEWRKGSRFASSEEPEANNPEFESGTKQYCKGMTSCEEAIYYLEHCGLSRLDGDEDGAPCESLCQ